MGTHPIFESDFDCLTEQKNMNRPQPPNIIAAQQKLLEGISRQSAAAQNSPEHMKLQQQLKLLGQQVQAAAAASKTATGGSGGSGSSAQAQVSAQQLKQLAGKHNLNQLRQASTPYARPSSGGGSGATAPAANTKPPITQKYEDLVNVIEELGKDVRPTYAGSKSAAERLKRGLQHARQLVRESQSEAEKLVRSQN